MGDSFQSAGKATFGIDAVIGVVGAGAMGAGIAQVAALAGHRVLLYDTHDGAAQAAIARIAEGLDQLVRKQKLGSEDAGRARERLRAVDGLNAFRECWLAIEAIVEELEAKRRVFRDLERIVAGEAILATNTSSIPVTAIGAALERPERLAGMHFFNPAPAMPLVEIISGAATSEATIDVLFATALRWGKTPVRARSTPGFIVNRVARPFYAEALRLLEEQAADCPTIDAVLREAGGFRMGAFELMDLIGHDVNYAVTKSVFDAYYGDSRFRPSNLQLELVRAGFLGRKSGRGFYRYKDGKPVGEPATAGLAPMPDGIQIFGRSPLASALAERLSRTGARFSELAAHPDARAAACGECVFYATDGRTATARAASSGIANTVVVDLALDATKARRIAIAVADQASFLAQQAAVGILQAAGFAVSVIGDVPGMIVMRTVAMLANEAADAVNQGVCTIADLNLALRKGVSYPLGPLEWADRIGVANVLHVLGHLAAWYGEDRYRASPLLRRKALAQARFTEGQPAPADGTLTDAEARERSVHSGVR